MISIVGTRPNIIKLAAIDRSCARLKVPHSIIDTNQHFDHEMSSAIYEELEITGGISRLKVSGLTSMANFGEALAEISLNIQNIEDTQFMVYGDTHSTFLGAYVAKRFGKYLGHVEAGLRSNNRSMPEELNRLMVDDISDRLYAPTQSAYKNLVKEGKKSRSLYTGDVVIDLLEDKKKELTSRGPNQEKNGIVVTLHRPSNVDNPKTLLKIFSELEFLHNNVSSVTLIEHPRLIRSIDAIKINLKKYSFKVISPLTFFKMLETLYFSELLITDSGGLQRDAEYMGTKCITIRKETEWLETLESGWNKLCPNPEEISHLCRTHLEREIGTITERIRVKPYADILVEDFIKYAI
jgi:UDP-N-acetylglucosamine 2-epimerase